MALTLANRLSLPAMVGRQVALHGSPSLASLLSDPRAVYDFSDTSKMFQDSAGTTPMSATPWGETVGLVLEQSGNGPNLHQTTPANRPVLGRHPFDGRRNLLTYTEDFSNSAWLKARCTPSAAPEAGDQAIKITVENDAVTGQAGVVHNSNTGVAPLAQLEVKKGNHSYVILGTGNLQYRRCTINLDDGAVVYTQGLVGLPVVEDLGGGWYRVSIKSDSTATQYDSLSFGFTDTASGHEVEGVGSKAAYIRYPQAEEGTTRTPYQKVASEYDVTEAGKADCVYLRGNGVNWCMETTAALDLSDTDQVSVFSAVQKLSDASSGSVVGLTGTGSNSNGSFEMTAPNGSNDTFAVLSRGTVLGYEIASGYAAPTTNILSGVADISGADVRIRIDGADVSGTQSGDQGTGNYSSAAAYVGSRGGSSNFFNGNLYGLAISGVVEPDTKIAAVEARLAKLAGITL